MVADPGPCVISPFSPEGMHHVPAATLFPRANNPKLIGLHGFKRSGKDEVYKALRHLYGDGNPGVTRLAFTDRMKHAAALSLGYQVTQPEAVILMDQIKDDGCLYVSEGFKHEIYVDGRDYLIAFGQGMRAVLGDDVWVDAVLPPTKLSFDMQHHNVELVVVTDVRQPNEAHRVLALGGEIWNVVRPGVISDGKVTEQPLPDHQISKIINNDGSLDDLQIEVMEAL